jgi:hypothetical protein
MPRRRQGRGRERHGDTAAPSEQPPSDGAFVDWSSLDDDTRARYDAVRHMIPPIDSTPPPSKLLAAFDSLGLEPVVPDEAAAHAVRQQEVLAESVGVKRANGLYGVRSFEDWRRRKAESRPLGGPTPLQLDPRATPKARGDTADPMADLVAEADKDPGAVIAKLKQKLRRPGAKAAGKALTDFMTEY